ncbi:MAG: ribonuclease H-like domain-containing protein [Synergistaceae bacterium]|nr:ribonuclease H-like domain-containing protein [Synergistaceae bacterium]
MPRPRNQYDPERFGRLDGLLPQPEGRITRRQSELPKELEISGLPEGKWVARGVYRMERRFMYGRAYGLSALEAPAESGRLLARWGGSGSPLFLDTETTGLSGGTGTYAFLIGLGICGGDALRVIQLFLAGPTWERDWLAAIEEELPEEFSLVTYNGRAFDLPLLRTRYTLARAVPLWEKSAHLDLLTLARHFYKGRLSSCSLSSIERNILGLHRSAEDVPGSEIPWMYTQFLRSSDAAPLAGIFYHNVLDIVSLAAFQRHIAKVTLGGGSCASDMLRAGDLWAGAGDYERAERLWRMALDFPRDRHLALLRLAEKERSAGNFEAAYACYKESLETERRPVRTLETMAKIEEHRFRRCEEALALATEALRWLERHRIFKDRRWEEDRKNLLHRIERLKRKIAAKECGGDIFAEEEEL